MKTAAKWILGIALGLIVLGAIVAIGYVAYNQWEEPAWVTRRQGIHPWEGGQGMPMQTFRDMPHLRIVRYSPLRILGGGLIFVGILVLIGLGIAGLVRSLSRPLPAASTPTPIGAPATSLACPNCGSAVQQDWRHCPYCGTVILSS